MHARRRPNWFNARKLHSRAKPARIVRGRTRFQRAPLYRLHTNKPSRSPMKVKTLVPLLCVLATASVWPLAHAADAAKDYPSRPIRLIVPNAPGSAVDTLSRIVGTSLTNV